MLTSKESIGFPAGSDAHNAGDEGSIPDLGDKIPQATGQLSPCATTARKTHLSLINK